MSVAILELRQVSRTYQMGETSVAALQACDLSIAAGEFIALHGPSGSGKSTLCNVLGLLDTPNSGEVLLQGEHTDQLSDKQLSLLRNQHIGFVFQQFNLIPVLNALENTLLPLQLGRRCDQAARLRAVTLLQRLGLGDHLHHRPRSLSGGQQQRVAIARALVTAPSVVVADEPTANLDSRTASEIVSYMRELCTEQRVTFVFSTHDPDLIAQASRQVAIHDGVIASDTGVQV
ncbi:MAG: ABC transporter ATP-binding protein [Oceanococcus sp.]